MLASGRVRFAAGSRIVRAPRFYAAGAGADGDLISTLSWDQDVADGGCILVGLAYRSSQLPSSVTCDDEPMSFVSLLELSSSRQVLVYAARGQSGGTKTIRVNWSSNVADTAAGSVAYNGVVAPPHAVQTASVASAGSLSHARTAEPGELLVCFHAIVHGSVTANITSTGGGTQRFIRTGVRDAALAISDSEVATTFSMTSSQVNSTMGQTSLVLPGTAPLPQFHSVGGSVTSSATTNPSFSVSPADEAYLIVIVHYYSTVAHTLNSVTCNGQPLSLIGSMKPADKESHTLAVYGAHINPGVGGPSRQVALSFSGSVGVATTAVAYTGVGEVVWQSDSTAVANSIAHPASCGPRQRVVGILTASNDGSGAIGLTIPQTTGGTQRIVTGSGLNWIRVAVADAVEDTLFTLTRNTSTACNMAAVSLLLKPY